MVAALFVEQSIRYPDGNWDAFAIWNLRARALYRAPHDLALVFTGELPAQHPYYPPLLPSLIAHGWFALGASTPAVPIAVSLLFGAAGVVALAAAVAERRGPALGLAAALLLLGTPELLTLATNQYADLKLAMLLLVAVVLASSERFVAAGLVAGLCAYTKNEGLLEFAALWVAIFVVSGRRAALRFLAGAALPLALLGTFEAGWAPRNALVADLRLTDILHRAPGRLLLVLRGFAAQLVDFPAWGCTLPFVFLCWMVGFRRSERTVPAVFVALSIAVFFAIYLTTPHDPAEHMASSLDRLLFQIWPSLIYATAVSLLSGEARAGVAPLRSAADRA